MLKNETINWQLFRVNYALKIDHEAGAKHAELNEQVLV
jgi:hypothetical protein